MIQKFLNWLERYQYAALAAILVFAALTRLWRLGYPDAYYFDEVYHVVTAKLIAYGDPSAYEWWHPAPEPGTAIDWLHPPLAKLFQATTMILFGFTSFSWRVSSALFGIGVVGMTFAVAKKLKLPAAVAVMAAFLAASDGLLLTMSRVTMNDIHLTFFYLITVFCYLNWKETPHFRAALFTALAAGLAVASKWSGVFVLGLIAVDLLWNRIIMHSTKIKPKAITTLLGLVLFLVPTLYILSYSQMWLQGKDWAHFSELHQQIWWYQNNLEATHPYQSSPLQWIFALRPVYAYTENTGEGFLQNIYFQANPLLLWTGVAAVAFSLGTVSATALAWLRYSQKLWSAEEKTFSRLRSQLTQKLKDQPLYQAQLFFLLLAFFSTWIVWLQSPRIMFFYHYTPAIPFLCLIIALQLWTLRTRAGWLIPVVLSVLFFSFLILFPNLTALRVPSDPWYSVFFALESWR